MKRSIYFLLLMIILFEVSSCKNEEVQLSLVTFSRDSSTVSESDGEAYIVLVLDKVATGDIQINYMIEGSASSGTDYEAPGSITIDKGAVDGIIALSIIDDNVFEFDPDVTGYYAEKLKVTLTGISGAGRLPENIEELNHTLLIFENDPIEHSLTIELKWNVGDGTPGDVDMDLLLYMIDPKDGPILVGASQQDGTSFEGIIIGTPAPDASYGLAYRYFDGSSDKVDFTVKFIAQSGSLPDGIPEKVYNGSYTLANVNGDVSASASVKIVQFFDKLGSAYSGFTEIAIPVAGSRAAYLEGNADKNCSIKNIFD